MQAYFKKELIISLSIIFGSILLLGTAILFLSYDVAAQAEKVVSGRNSLLERANSLGVLAELKSGAIKAAVYRQAMNKILVTKDQLLDFRGWLDGLARGRNLTLSFSFRGETVPPSGDLPASIGFSLGVKGGLEDVLGFLKDIEFASPRFLLSLDDFSGKRDGLNYDFIGDGKVFFTD